MKPANESGGYGLLDRRPGHAQPSSTTPSRTIEADPRNWVAQPILSLSTVPTLCDGRDRTAPRRPAAVHPQRRDAATSPPAASRGSPSARARSSSTPRRAAAARTPGSWRPTDVDRVRSNRATRPRPVTADDAALPRRRQPLLGCPIPRTRRGHRPGRAQLHRARDRPADERAVHVGAACSPSPAAAWPFEQQHDGHHGRGADRALPRRRSAQPRQHRRRASRSARENLRTTREVHPARGVADRERPVPVRRLATPRAASSDAAAPGSSVT